jgi:hypothetical protein
LHFALSATKLQEMITDEIKELMQADPFQPVRIILGNQQSFVVAHTDYLMVSPDRQTVVSSQPQLTSTSTGKASIPLTAADKTRASMGGCWAKAGARAMRFLRRRGKGGSIRPVPSQTK